MSFIIKRDGYTVRVGDPELYVDNQKRGRSGHMTHAIVEYERGKLLDFNSNCSAVRDEGHSTFGFVEYRYSEDGGKTFSPEIHELPYSKKALFDGINVISVEKAVACDDGTIVAICLRNCATTLCQPWDTPMIVRSTDGGKSWTEEYEMCAYKGRVYDAVYHNGVIYALEFCNDGTGDFCGEKPEHLYRLFKSENCGESFSELCVVPIPSMGRGYGSILFDNDGTLHVYAYNINDEKHMDHITSRDCGRTWDTPDHCFLDKGIRNPQTALVNGIFILHGRSDDWQSFVLYSSCDGETWSEGTILETGRLGCYYSNNIVLKDSNGSEKLLIQYSQTYAAYCVNIMHTFLTVER